MDKEVTALKATLLAQQWLLEQQEEPAAVGHYLDKSAPSVTWEEDHLVLLFPGGDRYEFFKDHMRYLQNGTGIYQSDGLMHAKISSELPDITLSFDKDPIHAGIYVERINFAQVGVSVFSLIFMARKPIAYFTHSRGLAVQKALQTACTAWNLSH
jgi:hypothetical protein